MRIVFLIGMLTALSGCGSYRDVTFLVLSQRAAERPISPCISVLRRGQSGMRKIRHEGGAQLGQLHF